MEVLNSIASNSSLLLLSRPQFSIKTCFKNPAINHLSPSHHHIPLNNNPLLLVSNSFKNKLIIMNKFKISSTTPSSSSSIIGTNAIETSDSAVGELDDQEIQGEEEGEKFEWYSQWYPVAPVCDLDKKVPLGKKVMGIDVVVWWDKNEGKWQVFKDSCPHRLAPLSEGRIDQWGRLQCAYHGWCFDGAGNCKFIPQAPQDGPPIHKCKKACAAVYPSIEQNKIVWFWPSTEPQYKNISATEKPPHIPELDDPSFRSLMGTREIPYGYEVLFENIVDPAHVPYAHHGILQLRYAKADREGGTPMEINILSLDKSGFLGNQENEYVKFAPPFMFYMAQGWGSGNEATTTPTSVKEVPQRNFEGKQSMVIMFLCIPVSPGKSRLIWCFSKNFGTWIDRLMPRWVIHITQNLVLDSDLYLLYLEEQKLIEAGPINWQKTCYVPTKADAPVVAFRKWLKKYSSGVVDWGTKYSVTDLPPTPSREQLFDRYWSHVVNCSSCSMALKAFKAVEFALPIFSLVSIGLVAAFKHGILPLPVRIGMVYAAVLCFGTSRWLSRFIYKTFYFHDYNHSIV